MKKLEFHYFHLMPWPYLPADFDEKYDSAWVTLPNSIYDPVRGHELYNRYLDEIERADKLGWDSVSVNEHHQNAYGTMPSPNLMAAVLTQRVKRAKIGIVGNALPLHDDPLRVAEEIAMLDVISGGRIISGFVRGTGMEYYSYGVNPVHSRDRFYEAHDLTIRAWTEPGPFPFVGKHYRYRYVNPWPRPLQVHLRADDGRSYERVLRHRRQPRHRQRKALLLHRPPPFRYHGHRRPLGRHAAREGQEEHGALLDEGHASLPGQSRTKGDT